MTYIHAFVLVIGIYLRHYIGDTYFKFLNLYYEDPGEYSKDLP
jgi:hypothetical protein